jgi:hypothetical protein
MINANGQSFIDRFQQEAQLEVSYDEQVVG